VLVPAGRVYVRGFFADSSHLDWLAFFPGAMRTVARFPTIIEIARDFGQAGFQLVRADETLNHPRRYKTFKRGLARCDTLTHCSPP
jgi:hypothetical protein